MDVSREELLAIADRSARIIPRTLTGPQRIFVARMAEEIVRLEAFEDEDKKMAEADAAAEKSREKLMGELGKVTQLGKK